MAGRCDLEDMYLFTTSIIQAERLGTSMGKALVEQADNMRERYRQRIKAEALKAPIKILFPLILLIFPSVFIIILLPPIINILNHLDIMP
ncbi:MAG: type II secretion system F family protein [Selenomonadaceae bacterium]|nr:type II secretion system F family protein [Selenomonadaceae bacterium]